MMMDDPTTYSNFDNDGSGNFKTIVENRNQANTITNLQYADQDNTFQLNLLWIV